MDGVSASHFVMKKIIGELENPVRVLDALARLPLAARAEKERSARRLVQL